MLNFAFDYIIISDVWNFNQQISLKCSTLLIGGGAMPKAEYKSAVRSRKLICSALIDLLLEKPLDKITVTDVVRRAEINRGTFYAHFTDIPDVINHIIQQTFSRIKDALSDNKQSFPEIPGVLLKQIQSILEDDLDFYRRIMSSSASSQMEEQLINLTIDYLIENENEFRFADRNRYILTIRFCAGGLGNLYRDWFAGVLPLTLDELTEKCQQLLITIISAANL